MSVQPARPTSSGNGDDRLPSRPKRCVRWITSFLLWLVVGLAPTSGARSPWRPGRAGRSARSLSCRTSDSSFAAMSENTTWSTGMRIEPTCATRDPSAVMASGRRVQPRQPGTKLPEVDAGPVALDEVGLERGDVDGSVHGRDATATRRPTKRRPPPSVTSSTPVPRRPVPPDRRWRRSARRHDRPELRPGVDAELQIDAPKDVADRLRRKERPLGDLSRAQAGRRQFRHAAAPSPSTRPGRADGGRPVRAPSAHVRPRGAPQLLEVIRASLRASSAKRFSFRRRWS